ncbi:type I toxin-antitoxin system SymE family toxin [Bacteroidales bacterium OttesenSCG-928-B11]|nr:type I toxin-antitoxin system SymE family toxin [Bacteroidales bacterium OttesenSCG-928-E04]MDL2313328.1 type I toxin-antitoxin system SymE family toxin [Bacteroidales bacterium OttesenSCG-928-B11]MDL2326927.1 type I toxin-antitoxin system SymE family toxin [Bacteroidales bacterium OttesenSCG-928-A14]
MKAQISKTLKLQGKYRESRGIWRGCKTVPWLSTSGVWLEKLGFHIGDTVRITAENGKLIIELQTEKQ